MPVLYWTRTISLALARRRDLNAFDFVILQPSHLRLERRPGAARLPDWGGPKRASASGHEPDGAGAACAYVVFGLRCGRHLTPAMYCAFERLQRHFCGTVARPSRDFLEESCLMPERLGHEIMLSSDDPPFRTSLLPRIMSRIDYTASCKRGICPAMALRCSLGSLGARPDNDLPGMIKAAGDRFTFCICACERYSADIRVSFY